MNQLSRAVSRIFSGSLRSVTRYPAALLCALGIAVIASVRVWLDTAVHDRLLTSLQLSLLFGTVLAMAAIVLVIGLTPKKSLFWAVNSIALLAAAAAFLLLYLPVQALTGLAIARMIALSVASFFLFLLFISRDPDFVDFSRASFMTLKAALIAAIYALVIMLGLMFIAFTVESLLYKAMSEEVYLHIAIWSAFAWFSFFLGYFPDFRRDMADPQRDNACRQPRFIEVLFAYVLIPLMTLLTVVLLIWAVQILIVGDWPSFNQLAVIFTTYTLFGLFLALMVSHDPQPVTRQYSRLYPFAALVFLAFEAYAWIMQIRLNGLLANSYFIAVLCVFALTGTLVLLFGKMARSRLIPLLAAGLSILVVLPWIGYHEAPVLAQTERLKRVLMKNQMLSDGTITQAPASISDEDKVIISRSAQYLLDADDVQVADWFTASIRSYSGFKTVVGFDFTSDRGEPAAPEKQSIDLTLPAGSILISGYSQVAYPMEAAFADFADSGRAIRVELVQSDGGQDVALSIQENKREIHRQDLRPWLDDLALRYPDITKGTRTQPSAEELSVIVETEDFRILVVFQSVWITWQEDNLANRTYWVALHSVYYGKKG